VPGQQILNDQGLRRNLSILYVAVPKENLKVHVVVTKENLKLRCNQYLIKSSSVTAKGQKDKPFFERLNNSYASSNYYKFYFPKNSMKSGKIRLVFSNVPQIPIRFILIIP
jgi:hypothetical protein